MVAKPGLDGHDRGALVLCHAFRDAGMEVIYTGILQTPEQIVETALQEDVDVVALSLLNGAHMTLFPRVRQLLIERNAEDTIVCGGGIIPEHHKPELIRQGITGLYGPGTLLDVIINHVVERVKKERWKIA